jgi:hypothetical protein
MSGASSLVGKRLMELENQRAEDLKKQELDVENHIRLQEDSSRKEHVDNVTEMDLMQGRSMSNR